ncbi:MAG: hypothetical protein OXU86_06920 [Thaumarchaeota archaeon]|nr:hypothetical protein [Nitrososphaerota archaeon]
MKTSRRGSGSTRQGGRNAHTGAPMEISVKNFGPISKGTIKMRPLTVIIGPSNSGKSYMARLSYCIYRSFQILRSGFNVSLDSFMPSEDLHSTASSYTYALSDMRTLVKKLHHERDIAIPTSTVSHIHDALLHPFPNTLAKELRREFRGDLQNLVRFSTSGFSIGVSGTLKVRLGWPSNPRANLQVSHMAKHWAVLDQHLGTVSLKTELDGKTRIDPLPSHAEHFAAGTSKELEDDIARNLVHMIMGKIRTTALPADTSTLFFSLSRPVLMNILGSHSSSEDDERHTDSELDQFSPPGLPKGFFKFVLSIDVHKPGPLSKLADMMERDLLGGSVSLNKSLHASLPTISFKTQSGDVPLRLTSSHVGSMALLTIYLKYLIKPGYRIIIEEPEAHMHPANQLKFAKHVALLIRHGVNVTLVTHSVLIVEQLSAYMMLGSLDKSHRKKAVSEPEAYLTLDDVSAHEFVVNSSGNCIIRDLPCTKHDGIDQEEFGKMRFNMYEERLSFRQQIEAYMGDPEDEKA